MHFCLRLCSAGLVTLLAVGCSIKPVRKTGEWVLDDLDRGYYVFDTWTGTVGHQDVMDYRDRTFCSLTLERGRGPALDEPYPWDVSMPLPERLYLVKRSNQLIPCTVLTAGSAVVVEGYHVFRRERINTFTRTVEYGRVRGAPASTGLLPLLKVDVIRAPATGEAIWEDEGG